MKLKNLKTGLIILLLVFNLCLICVTLMRINNDNLTIWMTYDEVAEIMPHDKNKLQRSPVADDYVLNEDEKKCLPVYYLDLEVEYGVTLGFNENFELVLINNLERAIVSNPSGAVPVLTKEK